MFGNTRNKLMVRLVTFLMTHHRGFNLILKLICRLLTWKCDTVFTSGKIVFTTLGSIKVAGGIIISHGVVVGVDGRLIGVGVHVGLVGHLGGWLVGHHRGGGGHYGSVNDDRGGGVVDNSGGVVDHRPVDNDRGVVDHGGRDHSFDYGSNWGGHNKFLSGSGGSGSRSSGSGGSKSFDEASSDGVLEVSASEHSHVVGWLLELEQDGQVSSWSCSNCCDEDNHEAGL